ncbi:MAG: RDD family protein [Acidimicrobiales bacterium]
MQTSERPADLGWRIAARVVDIVVFTWLLVFVLVEIDQRLLGGDPLGRRSARLVLDSARPIILLLLLVVVYEIVPAVAWGATPGKALLGLRVRRTSAAGPPWLMALGRAAVLYLPVVFFGAFGFVVPLVLLISVAIAADGRGLHDRLVGTLIVSIPREPDPERS